jgi:hypothetical protein
MSHCWRYRRTPPELTATVTVHCTSGHDALLLHKLHISTAPIREIVLTRGQHTAVRSKRLSTVVTVLFCADSCSMHSHVCTRTALSALATIARARAESHWQVAYDTTYRSVEHIADTLPSLLQDELRTEFGNQNWSQTARPFLRSPPQEVVHHYPAAPLSTPVILL